jgi:hypothetical protein
VNTLLGVAVVTALGGVLVAADVVATGTEVGAGPGVLLVVEHAASQPNANRAIVKRTKVFILTSLAWFGLLLVQQRILAGQF